MAEASVRQAQQVQQWLAGWSDPTARRLDSALRSMAPLVQQGITQAERRVLRGETVPASEKLVSLFEPHTAIVRRGKAHLPAEFGRQVMLDEVDGGLVTRYAVLAGNPPDAPELPTSLAHHQALFDHTPAVLTADRAFFTFDNDQLARDLRIASIALPRQGPLTIEHQQVRRPVSEREVVRAAAPEGVDGDLVGAPERRPT